MIEKDEIDIMEVFIFLKGKYKSILLTSFAFIIVAVAFVQLIKDRVTVVYTMDVNIQTPSTYISCNEDALCKLNIIASVVSGFLPPGYNVTIDDNKYSLSASVKTKRENLAKVEEDLLQLKSSIEAWYAGDARDYLPLTAGEQGNAISATETFALLKIITETNAHRKNIFQSAETIKETYNFKLIYVLAFILGVITSSVWHLMKRAFRSYQLAFV